MSGPALRCARMKYIDVLHSFRGLDPVNHLAGFIGVGIPPRSHHHADAWFADHRNPSRHRAHLPQRHQQVERSSSIIGSMTCASGSPKRTLNSITFGSIGGQHEPDKKEASELAALAAHAFQDGQDDLVHDARLYRRVEQRARRVGAHATSVRTEIAVQSALVIFRRSERQRPRAVAQHEERRFAADEAALRSPPASRPDRNACRPSSRALRRRLPSDPVR